MSKTGDAENTVDAEGHAQGEVAESFQDAASRIADSSLEEFKAHADQNLWERRLGKGYRKQGKNHALFVFGYVHTVYGDWIERGVRAGNPLTLEDFRAADKPLFRRLSQELTRREMPNWLYLPLNKEEPPISLEEFKAKVSGVPEDLQLMQPPRKPSRYILELRAKYGG